ncbi:TPA: molybdenum cofactor guanylyltransferase [bacterium]|nr:molybdenum cofactor guanylyltransferase [bacterium]
MEFTGVILAGGKSRRLGYKTKALLQVGGKRIIERVLDAVYGVTDKVILITNSPDDYKYLGLFMFSDIISDSGPVGGIYTGLVNSQTHQNIIIACDMPFIKSELLELLILQSDGYDIVIPETIDGYHPLCAVYSKNCIKPAEFLIKNKSLKVTNLFQYVRVNKVIFDENSPYYTQNMLFNVNTYEDYIKAEDIAKIIEASKFSQC